MTTKVDRAALVRRAIVELVATNGIHGTSMNQVAERAGVATGTTYVHYGSKEELLVAAFVEVKRHLGGMGVDSVDFSEDPETVFTRIWRNVYAALRDDPDIARFLLQVEASPLRTRAHDAIEEDDMLAKAAVALTDDLVDLPPELLYDLGLAPAVRLVATDASVAPEQLNTVIRACWRAIEK